MNLDWHADRSDLPELVLLDQLEVGELDQLEVGELDQLEVGEPIDLAAVRGYRLGRVREQMAAHQLDACVLLDPREHCGPRASVGVERVNAGAVLALVERGLRLADAQASRERAGAVKSAEELKCVRASVRATEVAVARLRTAIRPGLSENERWSVLHQGVITLGGDYIETRLLSSGPRTNPWFQETGDRRLGENELVALDTDGVGCHDYYCCGRCA